jgi:beta-lactam-binding protein with PASTA domain
MDTRSALHFTGRRSTRFQRVWSFAVCIYASALSGHVTAAAELSTTYCGVVRDSQQSCIQVETFTSPTGDIICKPKQCPPFANVDSCKQYCQGVSPATDDRAPGAPAAKNGSSEPVPRAWSEPDAKDGSISSKGALELVPNIEGKGLGDALQILSVRGFTSTVAGKLEAINELERLRVAKQTPQSGMWLTRGSSVSLTVDQERAHVSVPQLSGLRVADALSELTRVGLIGDSDDLSRVPLHGVIVREVPSAGSEVEAGSRVTLTIRGRVPAVTNAPLIEAVRLLADAGLKATFQDKRDTSARVVNQMPPAGTLLALDQSVSLTVRRDSGPSPPITKDQPIEKALRLLASENFGVEIVGDLLPGATVDHADDITDSDRGPRGVVRLTLRPPARRSTQMVWVQGDTLETALRKLADGGFSAYVQGACLTEVVVDKQDPPGGSDISFPRIVDLVVKPGPLQVPGVVGSQICEARELLAAKGLRPAPWLERSSFPEHGTVEEQQPTGQDEASNGSVIRLKVATATVDPTSLAVGGGGAAAGLALGSTLRLIRRRRDDKQSTPEIPSVTDVSGPYGPRPNSKVTVVAVPDLDGRRQ